MNVFLTGVTGFIGSYVVRYLVAEGHQVRCLVRDVDKPIPIDGVDVEKVRGDVTDPRSLEGAVRGCDAVIHLVGIIEERPSRGITFENVHYEGTKNVANEASRSGVGRFIHMSANGARADGISSYQTSKWKAEQYVRGAGFEHWTIFRPALVFGHAEYGHDDFAGTLARQLVGPFPILPVFGDGSFLLRPVSVEEVASAFVQALTNEKASGRVYCAAGREELTYVEALDRIALGMGRKPKPKLRQPLWLLRPVIHTLGRTGLLPVTPDQFEMLVEGNTCDSRDFYRDFDLIPKGFTPENLAYLRPPN